MSDKTKINAAASEYEKEFQIFSTNVNGAARACHYRNILNAEALANPKLLDGMNASPRFWNDYMYFTNQAVFIMLGCVFDNDKESHGIRRLLRTAKESNYFHKDSLRIRHDWYGKEPEKLDAYLDQTHAISASDFDRMEGFIDGICKDWQKCFSPVRHKVFAHQDRFSDENEKLRLLRGAQYDDLKVIIDRLLVVEHIFEQAGRREPDYEYIPCRSENLAKTEIANLIKNFSRP